MGTAANINIALTSGENYEWSLHITQPDVLYASLAISKGTGRGDIIPIDYDYGNSSEGGKQDTATTQPILFAGITLWVWVSVRDVGYDPSLASSASLQPEPRELSSPKRWIAVQRYSEKMALERMAQEKMAQEKMAQEKMAQEKMAHCLA